MSVAGKAAQLTDDERPIAAGAEMMDSSGQKFFSGPRFTRTGGPKRRSLPLARLERWRNFSVSLSPTILSGPSTEDRPMPATGGGRRVRLGE